MFALLVEVGMVSDRWAPGPVWDCNKDSFPTAVFFSIGVLLRLNIPARLPVGSSRSVI